MALGEWLKKKGEAYKQKKSLEANIKEKSKAAYYEEKEAQQIRVAKSRAKLEADQQIKGYKQRPRRTGFGGFLGAVGNIAEDVTQATNKSMKSPSMFGGPSIFGETRPTKKRKKKKITKGSSNYAIVGGKAYPIANSTKKKKRRR